VVKGDGGGQVQAKGGTDRAAQLDRRQRVQSGLLVHTVQQIV
jgi:hypothetical protein